MNVNDLIEKYETVIRINVGFSEGKVKCDEKRIEKFELENELVRDFIKELKQLSNVEYNRKVKILRPMAQYINRFPFIDTQPLQKAIERFEGSEYWHGCNKLAEGFSDSRWDWLLCDAIRYGFEVVEEPKYRVVIPNPNSKSNQSCWCLRKNEGNGKITIVKNRIDTFYESEFGELTEAEIKKDFGWAFQFAEPLK